MWFCFSDYFINLEVRFCRFGGSFLVYFGGSRYVFGRIQVLFRKHVFLDWEIRCYRFGKIFGYCCMIRPFYFCLCLFSSSSVGSG